MIPSWKSSLPLWIAGLAAAINFLWLLAWYLPDSLPLGHVSGIMTALAYDFSQGIFYRPLFDGQYFGGTRYMPLFFVLHGSLINIFGHPVETGLGLMFLSWFLLTAGFYKVLKSLGQKSVPALAFTCLAFSSINFMLIALAFKCDFLAAGFNLWGLYFVLAYQKSKSRLALTAAALVFTAAFMTKMSTLYGLAAGVIFLLATRSTKGGLLLAFGTGVLMAFGWLGINLLSDGRVYESFVACASGGMDVGYGARFLWWFLAVGAQDPFFMILFGLGLYLVVRTWAGTGPGLPHIYFGLCLAATLVLFSSPGADGNHLLDLVLASVLVLATVYHSRNSLNVFIIRATLAVISILVILSWAPGMPSILHYLNRTGKPGPEIIARLKALPGLTPGSLLSENPLLPVLMGRRPVVLDAFQPRLAAATRPDIRDDFNRKLESGWFQAVALLDYSGAEGKDLETRLAEHNSSGARKFYGQVHFFPGFLERLQRRYYLGFRQGPHLVYLLRGGAREAAP